MINKNIKKMIFHINQWNKLNKYVLYWYLMTGSVVVFEIVINRFLDKDVYFHPYISIFIRILLLIDFVLLPLVLATRSIIKDDDKPLMKAFLIIVSHVGIIIIGFILIVLVSLHDKKIYTIDTKSIISDNNSIYVYDSSYSNQYTKVYEKESLFFVKRIYEY